MHVPTSRLDALFTTRLSPTWQFFATAISFPPKSSPSISSSNGGVPGPLETKGLIAGPTNLQMTLQRDTGKWCTEYSYSADDSLWGFRVLHNFGVGGKEKDGKEGLGKDGETMNGLTTSMGNEGRGESPNTVRKRVDNLESDHSVSVGGGLRGRFSAGAEMFFSAAEKSAGSEFFCFSLPSFSFSHRPRVCFAFYPLEFSSH